MSVIATEKPKGRIVNKPIKDHTGKRYGRLVAIRLVERDGLHNDHKWLFQCDCGNEKVVGVMRAANGRMKSCGCLFTESLCERNTTHGLSRQRPVEYKCWKGMRSRCFNPNGEFYQDYGGRGIVVCERWNDFALFISDMGERPDGMTLDRIDVNGNYEPGNCRWATPTTQANNKRSNHQITIGNETRTLQQWCDHFGMEGSKVRYRLRQGWSAEMAFNTSDFRTCPH